MTMTMTMTMTETTPRELKRLGSALKEHFEIRVDSKIYTFDCAYFDMEKKRFHLLYELTQNKGYVGKEFVLCLEALSCQEINYTTLKIKGIMQRITQSTRHFSLEGSVYLHKELNYHFPTDPEEQAEKADFEEFVRLFDNGPVDSFDDEEKCTCGGIILPMYEEHPLWIQFCNRCDIRMENGDFSPLPY